MRYFRFGEKEYRVLSTLVTLKKSYKKKQWRPPSKKKKRGKNLSPGNMKACHNVSTALLKYVAEIGTHSAMKSSRKTLNEFTSHIPPKTPKRNISSTTNINVYGHNCQSAKSESQQHPCQ
jgi:hypothetical protein